MIGDLVIRPARDDDAEGLITLIGGCFAEYEGCVMDIDGVDSTLKAVETHFREAGGKFWVLEDPAEGNRIVASVGHSPSDTMGAGVMELNRLYVNNDYRRRGIATDLLNLILQEAREARARAVDLWSDTRFLEAHAFYGRHGFRQLDGTRDLNDPSNTTEYHFVREL